jgi:hypothetical protein
MKTLMGLRVATPSCRRLTRLLKVCRTIRSTPSQLNSLVAGFNDVQNKLNMLADVANDPERMGAVQPGVAAAMLAHGKGIEIGALGTKADMSRINEALYSDDVKSANQAPKDYVTAMV